MSSAETRALQWAATGRTGSSSNAILAVMSGTTPSSTYCHPHDGGDLGRCIGLLDAVPEFRSRLHEMDAVSVEWAALVKHWDEIEGMFRAGKGDMLYARMKEILDPIEAERSDIIKLGDGATIHFGK